MCLGFKPGVAGWSKTRIYGGHRPKQVWNKLVKVSFALTESSLEIWCFLDVNKIVKNRSLFRLRKQTWRLGRVWPDLANFHHFGEIFNCLAYLKGLFSILNSTFGKTFLTFEKNYWCKWPNVEKLLSYLVTLDEAKIFPWHLLTCFWSQFQQRPQLINPSQRLITTSWGNHKWIIARWFCLHLQSCG